MLKSTGDSLILKKQNVVSNETHVQLLFFTRCTAWFISESCYTNCTCQLCYAPMFLGCCVRMAMLNA